MGGAILQGVVASGVQVDGGIVATNRTREKADALASLPGVTSIALDENPAGNTDAAAAARIILVGVKPAMVPDLLREIAPSLRDDAIVVSLAAGVTLATFTEALGEGVRTVRSMPNTPATVGRAVTGIAAGPAATDDDMALVRALFEKVGAVIEVPESQIDALSTVSGSGPASCRSRPSSARPPCSRHRARTRRNCAAASPAPRAPPSGPWPCCRTPVSTTSSRRRRPLHWRARRSSPPAPDGYRSRPANRSMSTLVPETMMRSWLVTTVFASA